MPVNEFVMKMKNHLKTYTIVRNRLCVASDQMKTATTFEPTVQNFLLEIMFGCMTQLTRKEAA